MPHALRPSRRRAMFGLAWSIAALPLNGVHASASTLDAPIIYSLTGGLVTANFAIAKTTLITAFPLQSPPAAGFSPRLVTTLTDRQANDSFEFFAQPTSTLLGNPMGGGHTFISLFDTGAAAHIISGTDATIANFAAAGREGTNSIQVVGASGTETLTVSDAIGVYFSSVTNLTSAPASPLTVGPLNWRGHTNASVIVAGEDSALPSIIGTPLLGHYAVNINNSDTRRIVLPGGSTLRTPNVEVVPRGGGASQPFKMSLELKDLNGAAANDPFLFPDLSGDINDFRDNPSSPTNWTYGFAQPNLQGPGGSVNGQDFLFDTGAQITVISEALADSIGFDVGVDEPDFTIDILGVGGTRQAKGYLVPRLELPVIGGSAVFTDVPIVVLNVKDPRDGTGFIPGIIGMNLFTDRDLTIDYDPDDPYVRFGNPITPKWKLATGGNWLPDNNWILGVPDGEDVPANFLDTITSAQTINVDGNYTIGSMKFDNVNGYTLAGAGRLTFATLGRPSTVSVVKGSHTVSSPLTLGEFTRLDVASGTQLTLAGDTATPTAAVTKVGLGTVRLSNARYERLTVSSGTARILSGGGNASTSKVGTLQVDAGATLDLADSKMIVDYTGASPLTTLRAQILAGQITSGLVDARHAIGFGEASTLGLTSFGGQSFDGAAILMRLTLKGDANLSGAANFDDLLMLAKNFNATNRYWTGGDFDGSGLTDFNDLLLLAKNFNGVSPADGLDVSFAAEWSLAQSLVPEPTSVAALIGIGAVGVRRRNRV